MGQKVNANGFRVGVNKNWTSRWVTKTGIETGKWIVEDEKVRKLFIQRFVNNKIKINAQIVRIEIERPSPRDILVLVYCGQPGLIRGKDDSNLPGLILAINKIVGRKTKVNLQILPYENVYWSARVIAREIADAIENRISFRTAQKSAIKKAMSAKVVGVKTLVGGRLGGVEMARSEGYSKGIVPLTTIRADLDFAKENARTTAGIIGVKVWVNRGTILDKGLNNQITPVKSEPRRAPREFNRNREKGGEAS